MNHQGHEVWIWANGTLKKIVDSKIQPYDVDQEKEGNTMGVYKYLGEGTAHTKVEVSGSCPGNEENNVENEVSDLSDDEVEDSEKGEKRKYIIGFLYVNGNRVYFDE